MARALLLCLLLAGCAGPDYSDPGGFILDNRQRSVRTIKQLEHEYAWLAASGHGLCDSWRLIEGTM